MAKLLLPVFLFFLCTLSLDLLACGGGSAQHNLLSVAVTPQTADAADFSNGMVPFTAKGTYDRAPSPQVVSPASWDLEPSNNYPADAVSFSAAGVAQCKTGFAGTVTVRGGGFKCPSNPMLGAPCQLIFGTAQLTCP